jgi:hypothetical protein
MILSHSITKSGKCVNPIEASPDLDATAIQNAFGNFAKALLGGLHL